MKVEEELRTVPGTTRPPICAHHYHHHYHHHQCDKRGDSPSERPVPALRATPVVEQVGIITGAKESTNCGEPQASEWGAFGSIIGAGLGVSAVAH